MRLTTRGRYAVTAMLDLAVSARGGPVSVVDVSARHNISPLYLEQLLARLRQQRLVESVRGPGGGFFLARPPGEISVADIIHAVDEPIDATQCHGKLNCHGGKRCMTHQLWDELNGIIERYLASVTLARLVADQPTRSVAARPMKWVAQPDRKPLHSTPDNDHEHSA